MLFSRSSPTTNQAYQSHTDETRLHGRKAFDYVLGCATAILSIATSAAILGGQRPHQSNLGPTDRAWTAMTVTVQQFPAGREAGTRSVCIVVANSNRLDRLDGYI